MGRKSSIDRLPSEVRDWIGRLRDQGRTLDEIIAKLRELDVDQLPSRSALHRHIQKAEAIAEKMRRSRTVADVIVRRLGDEEPDKATRLNIELMHSMIFDVLCSAGEEGEEAVTLEPGQVMQLAKALDHLGKAAKDDVARTIAIERRAAEKARVQAAAQVETVAKAKGLSRDTIDAIKSQILGVKPQSEVTPS